MATYYTVRVGCGSGGSVSPAGNNSVKSGGSLKMYAYPSSGYAFSYWSYVINGSTYYSYVQNPTSSNITSDESWTCHFEKTTTYYTVRVGCGTGGSVSPAGNNSVVSGGSLKMYAYPDSGYDFSYWSYVINGTTYYSYVQNPTSSNITSDESWTCHFSAKTYYTCRASANDGSKGSVSPSGDQTKEAGSSFTWTATPTSNYYAFSYWQDSDGNTYTSNPLTVTPSKSINFTAYFIDNTYTCRASVNDGSRGSVSPTGDQTKIKGSSFTWTATPVSDYYAFSYWSGSDGTTYTSNPLTVTPTKDTTYTAYFIDNTYTCRASTNDATKGSVSPTGDQTKIKGSSFTWTATPVSSSYVLSYWLDSDGNKYTDNPLTVTPTKDMNYTAYFEDKYVEVRVSSSDISMGDTSPSGTAHVLCGAKVTYVALPNDGYALDYWEDGDGNQYTDVKLVYIAYKDTTLKAYFKVGTGKITTNVSPDDSGSVSGGGSHTIGTYATLTATPNEGYEFSSWSTGETSETIQVYVSGDMTITAYFELEEFEVTTDVYNNHGGEVDGADIYEYGEKCHLYAYPMELHEFKYWQDGGSSNPLSFRVYDDEHFTAVFGRKCKIFLGENRLKEVFLGESTLLKITLGDTKVYLY